MSSIRPLKKELRQLKYQYSIFWDVHNLCNEMLDNKDLEKHNDAIGRVIYGKMGDRIAELEAEIWRRKNKYE